MASVTPSFFCVAGARRPHDLIRRARRRDLPAIFGALPPSGSGLSTRSPRPWSSREQRGSLSPDQPGLGSRRCCDLRPSRIGAAAASHAVQDNGGLRATATGVGGDGMDGRPVSDMSEPCSRPAAIILSFSGKPSRELVEALVDTLITLLDAEDAVSYDMEPDADLEESDEGETETSLEWHLQDSVQRRRRGTVCNDARPAIRAVARRDERASSAAASRSMEMSGSLRAKAKCRTAVRESHRRQILIPAAPVADSDVI